MNPRMDKARFDAYLKEHGKLPPADHPTLGEHSDYMRNGSTMGTGVVVGVLFVIGCFSAFVVINGIWQGLRPLFVQ